ncbi:MAG: ribonuclease HI family protein [bacterium]|nr:ribonuclease HI family protein [bacterium]
MSDKIFPAKVIIFTDGGSRGNPGPSAIGVVLADEKGHVLKKYGQTIGEATNNQAEYQAVVFALKKFKSLIGGKAAAQAEVEIRSDSELLISQLSGQYKVLDSKIQSLFLAVWNLKIDYKKINFTLIPREKNEMADALANEALDQEGRAQKLI